MKTEKKSYVDELTDFYDKIIPNLQSNHNSLAVISFGSALKEDENYYPQAFWKECKFIWKK